MKVIETDRLILRKLRIEDAPFLYQILSDNETMIFYPSPYDMNSVMKWINKSINSYTENNFGLWAIILKESSQFLGQCGISLQDINGNFVPEIGYHIDKNFWNKAYATEAAKASLSCGFEHLKLDEIFIHTYINNIPSQRVAEKIGMKKLFEYEKNLTAQNIKWKHVVFSSKNNVSQQRRV